MNYDLPREREQEGEGERGLQWQQTNVGTGDKIERCVTVVPGSPKDTVLGVVPARGVAMPENAERHRAVSRIASQTPSPSAVSISLSAFSLFWVGKVQALLCGRNGTVVYSRSNHPAAPAAAAAPPPLELRSINYAFPFLCFPETQFPARSQLLPMIYVLR